MNQILVNATLVNATVHTMVSPLRHAASLLVASALLACTNTTGSTPPAEVVPPGCNALAYEHDCLMPYPSNQFLTNDATTPSGKRLAVPDAALVKTDSGSVVDFFALYPADGFSHVPLILALFPHGVEPTQLNTYDRDLARSLSATSPTVLLDAETGERILHVSELDPNTSDPARKALQIRPVVRLKNRHRYVVGIHDLRDTAGALLPAPSGFSRLRDRTAAASPVLAGMQGRFDAEVFPVLEAAGIARGTLQLAWDFTTESVESVSRDMLAARDATIAQLDATPPTVTIRRVEENPDPRIWRQVEGNMVVPSFMASEDLGAYLNRDMAGNVVKSRDTVVSFTILIPNSVKNDPTAWPARVLQYGHGFFGDRYEINGSFVTPYLDDHKMVGVAVDWWGMSGADIGIVVDDLVNTLSQALRFTERIHQGMMNQIALEYVVKHRLGSLPELAVNGAQVTDGNGLYYYGNSQGHILGSVYGALTRYTDRLLFGVGGMGFFSLIASRASPFKSYLGFIGMSVTDPLDQQKFLALGQSPFDRVDPATYAPWLRDGLPGGPARRHILMHIGLGDTSVPTLAGEAHARTLGLPLMQPSAWNPTGFTNGGTTEESAVEFVDFGLAAPWPGSFAGFAENDTEVHEGVRRSTAGQAQSDAFFRPNGTITHTCSGTCDPN